MNKEELIEKYLTCKEAQKKAIEEAQDVLNQLGELAPHKKGEIVRWVERKTKKIGTTWNYRIEDLGEVEKKAVVRKVITDVWTWGKPDVRYTYEFASIKKDGTLADVNTYPKSGYEWTGEYFTETE